MRKNLSKWYEVPAGLPWWVWILLIDGWFLLLTWMNYYSPPAWRNALLYAFNLTVEMNLGAWWSAMMLLTIGLLAYESHSMQLSTGRKLWLPLALVMVLLSVDETGSLHERIRGFQYLIPIALLMGAALLPPLLQLWRSPQTRRFALVILFGFSLYAFVGAMEFIEHRFSFPAGVKGLRLTIEELFELAGSFSILAGVIGLRRFHAPARNCLALLPDPARLKNLGWIAAAALVLHIFIFMFIRPSFDQVHYGNLAVWYPISAFLLLGMLFFHLARRNGTRKAFLLALSLLFFLNSAAGIYIISPRMSESLVHSFRFLTDFRSFYALQLLLLAGLLWLSRIYRLSNILVLLILGSIVLAGVFFWAQIEVQYIAGAVLAFLFLRSAGMVKQISFENHPGEEGYSLVQ